MVIETIVARHGLLAVTVGAGLQGEALVVLAGILAQQGWLPIIPTALCAGLGAFCIDQFWFHAARRMRHRPWVARFIMRPAYQTFISRLNRHETGFILAVRFIFGMRTASLIALGTSNVPSSRFLMLNVIAAAAWGCTFSSIGFAFGEAFLDLFRQIGPILMLIGLMLAIVVWRRLKRPVVESEPTHSGP